MFFSFVFCTFFKIFHVHLGKKVKVLFSRVYVWVTAKLTLVNFFYFFFMHFPLTHLSYLSFILSTVPSGYPNPTRYPVFLSIPDPTRFSFGNHRVAGNPKHRVLPDIPIYPGSTRSFGYYPIFQVSPVRGKQYHHQVLFFGNHKKDPRVQKK